MGLDIGGDGLGHPADDQILPEVIHGFPMHGLFHGFSFFKMQANKIHQNFVVQSPEKLFKIHWVELDVPFLRGDHDVLYIFANAHQGAGFDVVISSVCDQVFDGSPRFGKQLHFIQNDERFPGIKLDIVIVGQIQEKEIQIVHVVQKKVGHGLTDPVEIDHQIALVFCFGECLCNVAFSYPAGPVDQ